jgi:hypothetical protein
MARGSSTHRFSIALRDIRSTMRFPLIGKNRSIFIGNLGLPILGPFLPINYKRIVENRCVCMYTCTFVFIAVLLQVHYHYSGLSRSRGSRPAAAAASAAAAQLPATQALSGPAAETQQSQSDPRVVQWLAHTASALSEQLPATPGTTNAAAVGHRGAAPAIAAAVAPLDCRPPRTGPRRASFFLTRTIASAIFLRQVQRGSTITARTTETIAMLAPAAVARAPTTSRLTDGRAAGFRSLFAHGSAVAFLALTCTAVAFLILACTVHTRAMVSTSIHIRTYARDVEAEHQR